MRALLCFLLLFQACLSPSTVAEAVESGSQSLVRIYGPGFSCSGFYIGDQIFLTAAHCVDQEPFVWIGSADQTNIGVPVVVDKKADIATIKALKPTQVKPAKLNQPDQIPILGSQLITLGFPGYYNLSQMFEVGYVKDLILLDGVKVIVSRDMTHRGYSGGPAIDVETGKVIGLISSMVEIMTDLPGPGTDQIKRHQHTTLNYLISSDEIHRVLQETATKLQEG